MQKSVSNLYKTTSKNAKECKSTHADVKVSDDSTKAIVIKKRDDVNVNK